MSELIDLKNLTKDYGKFRALEDVNLTVGDGVTGLLGPNGAGKSTLIKVILGLVRTTSGTGHVLGHPLGRKAAEVRTKIGYMPEDDCYVHGLAGIETVQLAAELSRIPKTEALRRGHEILDFCGMGQERYRNVETYSTGMRQKLRFAMSIVHDPKMLILDEPTSGLDPEEREAMLNRIRILSRQFGKAVILCTHILPDVQVVCDDVRILSRGTVKLSGGLKELCETRDAGLTVQLSGEADDFVAALTRDGIRAETMTPRVARVFGEAGLLNPVLWRKAELCEMTIRSVAPTRNSLEQIFLEAVREVRVANS